MVSPLDQLPEGAVLLDPPPAQNPLAQLPEGAVLLDAPAPRPANVDVTDDARAARGFAQSAYLDGLIGPTPRVPGPPAPEDNSSLGGDLRAGGLQALNALDAAGLGIDQLRTNLNLASGEEGERGVARWGAYVEQLRGELANAASPAEAALIAPQLEDAVAQLEFYQSFIGSEEAASRDARGQERAAELTSRIVETRIPRMMERDTTIGEIPLNPAAEELFQSETFLEALGAFASDPGGVARTVAARSLPSQAPSVGGAVLGQFLGGPLGAGALAGILGGGTEAAAYVSQELTQAVANAGVDPNDPAAVEAFLAENAEAIREMWQTGAERGGIIAAVDAVTAGLAGGLVRSVRNGSRAARVGAIGGGAVIEGTGEGAGEAAAQLATTGEIQPGEVLAEVIGGVTIGAPQVAGQAAAEALRNPAPQTPPNDPWTGTAPTAPPAPVPPDPGAAPTVPGASGPPPLAPRVPPVLPGEPEPGAAPDTPEDQTAEVPVNADQAPAQPPVPTPVAAPEGAPTSNADPDVDGQTPAALAPQAPGATPDVDTATPEAPVEEPAQATPDVTSPDAEPPSVAPRGANVAIPDVDVVRQEDETGAFTRVSNPDTGAFVDIEQDPDGQRLGQPGWYQRSETAPDTPVFLADTRAAAIEAVTPDLTPSVPVEETVEGVVDETGSLLADAPVDNPGGIPVDLQAPNGLPDVSPNGLPDVSPNGLPDTAPLADATPDVTAPIQETTQDRRRRGPMTPSDQSTNFTQGTSPYEQAFRDAGVEPDTARLMPPVQQVETLANLMRDRFSLNVTRGEGRNSIKGIDAVDQLLDGYRNTQFMLNALGLPPQALSLGGRVTLQLERFRGQYLGAYSPDTKTIHLPGRSNSFAHEWMHALDHYLAEALTPQARSDLLSQAARREGLDPTENIQAAMVHLVNTMFFDEADLALRMLDLETKAQSVRADGQPTKVAQNARRQLEQLASGATRLRIDPTAYRADSRNYSPTQQGYYGSVHEMLARAFEAYIAHLTDVNGGTNAFITKGDETYLSDANRRLAMIYPKADERARIFSAFGHLFSHIQTAAMFGQDPVTAKPEDVDIYNPNAYDKAAEDAIDPPFFRGLAQEGRRMLVSFQRLFRNPGRSLRNTTSEFALNLGVTPATNETAEGYVSRAGRTMADLTRLMLFSARGYLKPLVNRQPDNARGFIDLIMSEVMTDPGTGRQGSGRTWEEAREREATAAAARIMNVIKSANLGAWASQTGRISKKQNNALRRLMLGENVPASEGGNASVRRVAATLRREMNTAYRRAVEAGIDMGFVEDTGYLPRVLVSGRVMDAPDKFEDAARQVYEIMFDREVAGVIEPADLVTMANEIAQRAAPLAPPASRPFRAEIDAVQNAPDDATRATAADALAAAIRDDYVRNAALDWKERILTGDTLTFNSLGPATNFTQARKLPAEADTIMEAFYESDTITSALSYIHNTSNRAAYIERFGTTGGTNDVELLLRRPAIQDAVRGDPGKYDPDTFGGRLNIITDLANRSVDDIKELAFREAMRAGARTEDLEQMRAFIEDVTGRGNRGRNALTNGVERISNALHTFTYVTLLPRAAWTSLAEPAAFFLKTGDVRNTARTFATYAREAVRSAQSTRDLARLAEAVGVVASPLHDVVLMNRMSGDFGAVVSGNVLMSRFFRANFLAQLTNAQRRATVAGGTYWLQDLAKRMTDPSTSDRDRDILMGYFIDLGVERGDMDALAEWLSGLDGLPSPDDLQSPIGRIYSNAIARFTDQTIQNPRRADKPFYAATPIGRLVYSLTSFVYTFMRNIHIATVTRGVRTYEISRNSGGTRAQATGRAIAETLPQLGGGFLLAWGAQTAVTVLREALFNAERWEEEAENDNLLPWLAQLGFSRTGALGPFDIVMNSLTGLRYERDLANLFVGAGPGYIASNVQNILNGLPRTELWEGGPAVGSRNTPNTNTSEHTALKSVYRLFLAPMANAALSALPVAGQGTAALRYGALLGASSNTASAGFADAIVGPSGSETN